MVDLNDIKPMTLMPNPEAWMKSFREIFEKERVLFADEAGLTKEESSKRLELGARALDIMGHMEKLDRPRFIVDEVHHQTGKRSNSSISGGHIPVGYVPPAGFHGDHHTPYWKGSKTYRVTPHGVNVVNGHPNKTPFEILATFRNSTSGSQMKFMSAWMDYIKSTLPKAAIMPANISTPHQPAHWSLYDDYRIRERAEWLPYYGTYEPLVFPRMKRTMVHEVSVPSQFVWFSHQALMRSYPKPVLMGFIKRNYSFLKGSK